MKGLVGLTHEEKELDDASCRLCISDANEAVGPHQPDIEPQIGEKHENCHPGRTPHNILSLHGLQICSFSCQAGIADAVFLADASSLNAKLSSRKVLKLDRLCSGRDFTFMMTILQTKGNKPGIIPWQYIATSCTPSEK